jgi:hypothetical protein
MFFFTGADNISWGGAMLVLQCPVTTHSPLNLENPVPPMRPGTSGKGTMMRIKTRSASRSPKKAIDFSVFNSRSRCSTRSPTF